MVNNASIYRRTYLPFKYAFDDNFIDVLISRVEQNSEIVDKILTNKAFGDWVKDFYMKRTYSRLNQ